jgi:hypothetical protein
MRQEFSCPPYPIYVDACLKLASLRADDENGHVCLGRPRQHVLGESLLARRICCKKEKGNAM